MPRKDVDIDDVECVCILDVDCKVDRLIEIDEHECVEVDSDMLEVEKDDRDDIIDDDCIVEKAS